METTKMLTSLLVLTLTGPTLGYPYTRGVASRSNGRGRDQVLDGSLGDYLSGYVQDQQYAYPEYQPTYRHGYAAQRPRINAEALAALLPYLTTNNDDYAYDYSMYNDNDGTWYDDTANEDAVDTTNSEDALFRLILANQRNRYSVEDLENLEREAEFEENTEDQLHALMPKKMSKKSRLPILGGRQVPIASRPSLFLGKGQKEEALDIPATSIRRPVFARQITTVPEQDPESQRQSLTDSSSNTQTEEKRSADSSSSSSSSSTTTTTTSSSSSPNSSSDSSSTSEKTQAMTPFMQNRYETLMKYLDFERKARQEKEQEQQELSRTPQKRFIPEQESLTQQLANLKKNVA